MTHIFFNSDSKMVHTFGKNPPRKRRKKKGRARVREKKEISKENCWFGRWCIFLFSTKMITLFPGITRTLLIRKYAPKVALLLPLNKNGRFLRISYSLFHWFRKNCSLFMPCLRARLSRSTGVCVPGTFVDFAHRIL